MNNGAESDVGEWGGCVTSSTPAAPRPPSHVSNSTVGESKKLAAKMIIIHAIGEALNAQLQTTE